MRGDHEDWVPNSGSNNLMEFNPSGSLVGTFSTGSGPESGAIDANGNIWIPMKNSNTIEKFSPSGAILATYSTQRLPVDVVIDSSGNVWNTNAQNNSITKSPGVTLGPQFFPYSGPKFAVGNDG